MGRFSSISRDNKTDNHAAAKGAKVAIRENVLSHIKGARVFDGFAGSGEMFRAVWHKADAYCGCDMRFFMDDDRFAYVGDNRRVMRVVDLSPFNIFDLDAYGSPWEQVTILAANRKLRPGEMVGLILTDGGSLAARSNSFPHALAALAGLRVGLSGYSRIFDNAIDRAIHETARRMNAKLVKRWQAIGKSGAAVRYNGLVFEGLATGAKVRRR